jgi:hypothetical protein
MGQNLFSSLFSSFIFNLQGEIHSEYVLAQYLMLNMVRAATVECLAIRELNYMPLNGPRRPHNPYISANLVDLATMEDVMSSQLTANINLAELHPPSP